MNMPEKRMAQPTCATCPYWVHIDGGEGIEDEGECHHGPPKLSTSEAGGLMSPHVSVWPPTHGAEWCGQHPAFVAWLAARATG